MRCSVLASRSSRRDTRRRRSRNRQARLPQRRPHRCSGPPRRSSSRSRPFQRLNRAEYQNAVRDLLNLDVDVTTYLPPDTISHGFDNVADSQSFSPTLMDGYLRAASQISRLAVGDRNASASSVTYKIPRAASQMRRVDGAPMGTRGGTSVIHTFPADGDGGKQLLALARELGIATDGVTQ